LLIAVYVPLHVNATFPVVGWDYKYYLSRMIDTYLHYRINGLSIQWYTSSFGGGMPAYPHPLSAQFSLPQLFTQVVDPWMALLVSYFIYALAGYICAYLFLHRTLQLHWSASTLGAALFSANGFNLEHLAIGHFTFQGFPLLPVFLVVLLSSSLPIPAAGAIIGLTTAILIYSASTFPAVYIMLSMLVCLPLTYMIRPQAFNWSRMIKITALGGLLALTIVISKLYAVNSFMRFFPRDMADHYDVPLLLAPFGLFLQLFGVMGLAPLYTLMGIKTTVIRGLLQAYTGSALGLWELDLSISPVIWFLLGGGLITGFVKVITRRWTAFPRNKGFWLALVLLLIAIEINLEFTFARGWIYPLVRQLPFLRAIHINPRFGVDFIMPMSLVGAYVFHCWMENKSEKNILAIFLPLNLLVVLSLGAYSLLRLDNLQQRTLPITGILNVYERARNGETFPIVNVGDVTDQTVFERQTSNLHPYESLFGYTAKYFKPTVIAGPAREIRDGTFNMTDPTGLVYPEINDSSNWSRIPESERAQLEDFLAHRQPDWKIPVLQQITNWISLLSLFANIGLLIYGLIKLPARRLPS
jgi:hypothetical protein